MTRSKKLVGDEDEDIVALKEQVALKDTTDKKNDKVKDKRNQWREKYINKFFLLLITFFK